MDDGYNLPATLCNTKVVRDTFLYFPGENISKSRGPIDSGSCKLFTARIDKLKNIEGYIASIYGPSRNKLSNIVY
ncbi:hypothetical protein [Candidatus Nitrosocosmicus sp. FF01]|uniref:hypothetical protein n=1 Tax=Candidatus Nitrosocosmicus sp. FF01 TaxID=3397670 RepID=UPI0039ED45FE